MKKEKIKIENLKIGQIVHVFEDWNHKENFICDYRITGMYKDNESILLICIDRFGFEKTLSSENFNKTWFLDKTLVNNRLIEAYKEKITIYEKFIKNIEKENEKIKERKEQ